MTSDTAFFLQSFTRPYDWGKLGSTSKVAQYAKVADPSFVLDERMPYAELWMGTHPTLPSKLLSGASLTDHLAENPELLGSQSDLPFLFKVLAIRKALSIQSHPSKELAKKLHKEQPQVYKDPNHKPEMAIALTPFKALCGFLPLPQIQHYLQTTPELCALIRPGTVSTFLKSPSTQALKALFGELMLADADSVKKAVDALVKRYSAGGTGIDEAIKALAIELNKQFPGDIGIFCVFVLNIIDLQPGEAIFLGPGEPHAYISGDIIECMATSDNVLRAGLTPKARDVTSLLASLTYNASPASAHCVNPTGFSSHSSLYTPPPPTTEFQVLHTSLPEGDTEHTRGLGGPSILIVTAGKGRLSGGDKRLELKTGSLVFVAAGSEVVFECYSNENLQVYRAFCE